MVNKLKYRAAEILKRHPLIWFWTFEIASSFSVFLPHEKSYWGLRHLIEDANEGLILDIGANNGVSALGFRAIGIPYKILSIEANTAHRTRLERVKRQISDFDYELIAAGSSKGQFDFFVPYYGKIPIHAIASFDSEYTRSAARRDYSKSINEKIEIKKFTIPLVALDDFNLKPNIIKIDIEGYDFQAILGLKNTIASYRPHLLVEYNPDLFPQIGNFFEHLDYMMFLYDFESDRFSGFNKSHADEIHSLSGLQVNVFLIPSEKAHLIDNTKS